MKKRRIISVVTAALLSAALLSSPAAAAAGNTGFRDVPAGAWYAEAVTFCQENGFMSGTGPNTFSPDSPATRAMIVTVLYRLAGSPQVESPVQFTDVAPGSWAYLPVAWATEEGIASGYGNGRFGASDPVSREQLVLMLWNFSGSPKTGAADFTDEASIASYAAGAVDWARANSVVSGSPTGAFNPKQGASRAEAASILMNYTRSYLVEQAPAGLRSVMDVPCQASGIAAMDDGSLLVTDTYRKVIWRVSNGVSTVYAGGETTPDPYGEPMGGYNDDIPAKSYFRQPWAIAPFLDGWAVSDPDNSAVRLVEQEQTQTVNGHTGERLKTSNMGVVFEQPTGLAADGEGSLYVSDTLAGAIRKITSKGEVSTVIANLNSPMGLCWKDGVLYAAETGANRVIKIVSGRAEVVAGSGEEAFTDGDAAQAAFSGPQGVAVDSAGTVYVADTGNSAVRQVRDGQVTTLISQDKTKPESFPISPVGLLVKDGRLYICDTFSRKVFALPLS